MGLHEICKALSEEECEEKVANETCNMFISGDQEEVEDTVRSE